MIINRNLCNGCTKCVAACPAGAISAADGQRYVEVDRNICTNCDAYADIECIRVCDCRAITREDGTVPEFDATPRLLTAHLNYIIAVMGERDDGRFPAGNPKWDPFRKMIAQAFLNPEMNIRLTRHFDDMCIMCSGKKECGKGIHDSTNMTHFEKLGIEPGTVMKFWEVIRLAEEKYDMPFLKQMYNQDFINSYCRFVSPDATALKNTQE